MANYNPMKKDELIKVLKERDAEISRLNQQHSKDNSAIAGFKETLKTVNKENDDLIVENGHLRDDIKRSNELTERLAKEKDALRIEKNAAKTMVEQKEEIISTLKRQRVILGIITIAAILIAIIF